MSQIPILSTHSEEPVAFFGYIPYCAPELDDLENIGQHCRTLRDNRQQATLHPLSEDWSFTATVPAFSVVGRSGARSIPYFARHGGDFRFTLDENLIQLEEDDPRNTCCAQVWVAEVTTLDGFGTHPDEEERERVVLKIVQPSMIPPPEAHRDDPWSLSPSARQLAFSENWTYCSLSDYQGIQIPWYFGKCEVKMPNGEQAHILIMEHIQGDTLDEMRERYWEATVSDKMKLLERLGPVLLSIKNTLDALESAGLFHKDIPFTDIIIDNNNKAVVVGFANKCLYDVKDIDKLKDRIRATSVPVANSQAEQVLNRLLSLHLRGSGEYESEFMEWASHANAMSRAWHTQRTQRT